MTKFDDYQCELSSEQVFACFFVLEAFLEVGNKSEGEKAEAGNFGGAEKVQSIFK